MIARNRTKIQVFERKNHGSSIFMAFILLIAIFSLYSSYIFINQSQSQITHSLSSQLKAAIVDQLSLTYPNQTFIETATQILKEAGYTVDYYSGKNVTVEFYRNLATHDYGLIVLRAHSTLRTIQSTGAQPDFTPESPRPFVIFFTSERFDLHKYSHELLTDSLQQVAYTQSDAVQGCTYFAVTPRFVRMNMNGDFKDTVIIMMGCNGLTTTEMAEALIQRGAKTYIGWDDSVTASHTDQATIYLLQYIITEKQAIQQGIDNTMKKVGSDPRYGSKLTYYTP